MLLLREELLDDVGGSSSLQEDLCKKKLILWLAMVPIERLMEEGSEIL